MHVSVLIPYNPRTLPFKTMAGRRSQGATSDRRRPQQGQSLSHSKVLSAVIDKVVASPIASRIQKRSPTRPLRRAFIKKSSQQRRRSLRLQGAVPIQANNSIQQAKTPKRPREEDECSRAHPSLQPISKRVRTSVSESVRWKTISEARIDHWRGTGTWPTAEQETRMDRFRELVNHALPKKRSQSSLRRKHSGSSINMEKIPTRTPSDQPQREQKSAPYRHPRYEGQLQQRGSFMDDHEEETQWLPNCT